MTVLAGSIKRGGLLFPMPSSSGVSPDASRLRTRVQEALDDLEKSAAVRKTAETAIAELRQVRGRTLSPNWDGYGARPLDARAYEEALRFLRALPTTTPIPDVSVDPDGEVDVLWHVDSRRTFSVSVGPHGRLTYAALIGEAQSYGTEWLSNEIPQAILLNLSRVLDFQSL